MDKTPNDLLQGTLGLLILKTLSTASLHGWDPAKRIAIVSRDRQEQIHRVTPQEPEGGVSPADFLDLLSINPSHFLS